MEKEVEVQCLPILFFNSNSFISLSLLPLLQLFPPSLESYIYYLLLLHFCYMHEVSRLTILQIPIVLIFTLAIVVVFCDGHHLLLRELSLTKDGRNTYLAEVASHKKHCKITYSIVRAVSFQTIVVRSPNL